MAIKASSPNDLPMAKKRRGPRKWSKDPERQEMVKRAVRAEARRKAVYGRKDEPPPPEGPSSSVHATPTAPESSRRRH